MHPPSSSPRVVARAWHTYVMSINPTVASQCFAHHTQLQHTWARLDLPQRPLSLLPHHHLVHWPSPSAQRVKRVMRRCSGSDAGGHAQRSAGCPPSGRAAAAERPRGSTRARGRAEALPPPPLHMGIHLHTTTSRTLDTYQRRRRTSPCARSRRDPSRRQTAQPRKQTGASRACYRRYDDRVAAQRLPGLGRGRSAPPGADASIACRPTPPARSRPSRCALARTAPHVAVMGPP
jgi:hypothetical protein